MGRAREATKVGCATALTIVTLVTVPLVVWALVLIKPESSPAPWRDAVVSEDGRSVTVSVMGGACDDPDTTVAESSTQVTITVRNEGDWFVFQCDDVGVGKTVTVELDDPLGGRELVDGNA